MSEVNDSGNSSVNENYNKRKTLCAQLYKVCTQPTDTFKFDTTFMEIWEFLTQISELEKDLPFCCAKTRNEEDFKNFIQYLKNNKVNIDESISIQRLDDSSDEYGLKSNRKLNQGDLIFDIPENLMITVNNALESPLNSLIINDKVLALMPNITLAVFILYLKSNCEKSDLYGSKWKEYLNILPNEFHTPLYFTLDEIKLLQPAQCFNDIILHIRNIARQYTYIFNLLDSKKEFDDLKHNFNLRNYKWAVSVVSTRQNPIIDDKQNPLLAMIPVLDMCNHRDGELSTEFDHETKSAKCYADHDISVGDEITIFYGKRNNKNLLIHNGFVPGYNKYNSVALKLGVSLQDPLFAERAQVLELFGINATETFELVEKDSESNNSIPIKIYVFVKIFMMKTVEELKGLLKLKEHNIEKYFKKNDLKSDEQIKKFIKMRLTILNRAYEQHFSKYDLNLKSKTSINCLFIHRLLDAEKKIIESINESF